MDTQVWDTDFIYKGPCAVKVSCHAGDFGTVALCNMVGDQPLFYIDDSVEEDFLGHEETMDIEMFPSDREFLDKMKAKLQSYDVSAKALSSYKNTLPEDAFDDIFKSSQTTTLKDIIDFGNNSAIFKTYFEFITDRSIQITLSHDVQTSFYDRENKQILLNPSMDKAGATCALIQAMRTVWNHKQGVLINPLCFQPDEAVIINRLMQADLDVIKVAYLWDLKLAGVEESWHAAMSGSDYDLCSAYAMEAMTDFRSIKGGLAMRSTFEKWFLTGRCKNHDRQIIQTMMGGHTDMNINNEDASRIVAMDVIAAIGNRPEGQNYLAPIVVQILNDPLYGEIRDRSNANFLWFVTFERKMAQVEQELHDGENDEHTARFENNIVSIPAHISTGEIVVDQSSIATVFFLDHFRAG